MTDFADTVWADGSLLPLADLEWDLELDALANTSSWVPEYSHLTSSPPATTPLLPAASPARTGGADAQVSLAGAPAVPAAVAVSAEAVAPAAMRQLVPVAQPEAPRRAAGGAYEEEEEDDYDDDESAPRRGTKRSADDADMDCAPRRDRKNRREKQRRMEVNVKFEELTNLLGLPARTKANKVAVLSHAIKRIQALEQSNSELAAEKASLHSEVTNLTSLVRSHFTPAPAAVAAMRYVQVPQPQPQQPLSQPVHVSEHVVRMPAPAYKLPPMFKPGAVDVMMVPPPMPSYMHDSDLVTHSHCA